MGVKNSKNQPITDKNTVHTSDKKNNLKFISTEVCFFYFSFNSNQNLFGQRCMQVFK